jgi:hypothetical protein
MTVGAVAHLDLRLARRRVRADRFRQPDRQALRLDQAGRHRVGDVLMSHVHSLNSLAKALWL